MPAPRWWRTAWPTCLTTRQPQACHAGPACGRGIWCCRYLSEKSRFPSARLRAGARPSRIDKRQDLGGRDGIASESGTNTQAVSRNRCRKRTAWSDRAKTAKQGKQGSADFVFFEVCGFLSGRTAEFQQIETLRYLTQSGTGAATAKWVSVLTDAVLFQAEEAADREARPALLACLASSFVLRSGRYPPSVLRIPHIGNTSRHTVGRYSVTFVRAISVCLLRSDSWDRARGICDSWRWPVDFVRPWRRLRPSCHRRCPTWDVPRH
jgi:hypothetical protein